MSDAQPSRQRIIAVDEAFANESWISEMAALTPPQVSNPSKTSCRWSPITWERSQT
jgi:hypothetical protein